MGVVAPAVLLAAVLSATHAEPRIPPVPLGLPCSALPGLEVSVARAPTLYAVVDGPSRRIELRAQGIVLRRFPLRGLSSIGPRRGEVGRSLLIAKRPLVEPAPRIPAPAGEETAQEPAAEAPPLTVADMPARYRLVFDDGLSVMVHPGGAVGRWRRLVDRLGALSDRTSAWGTVLGGYLAGARRRLLLVELSARDAQALYWSIRPPLPVLLRVACPPRGPSHDRGAGPERRRGPRPGSRSGEDGARKLPYPPSGHAP